MLRFVQERGGNPTEDHPIREEVPEFPPVAIREALLNAVGHRDYSLSGSAVEVRLFDDAIEIESPGTLAGWVTVENLRDARYSRNPRIMEIFHEDLRTLRTLETRESRGILQALVARGLLAPVGRGRGTRYVLGEIARTSPRRAGLDQQIEAVVAHARRTGSIANREVRGLLGVERAEALAILDATVAQGLLEAVGERRARRYLPTRG